MDRGSKLFIVLWAIAALAAQMWLLNGSWPGFWLLTGGAVVAAVAAAAWDRRAVSIVLVFAYAFPLLIRVLHGRYHVYYGTLWLGPLLGAVLPQALTTPWHVPQRWRVMLSAWAFVIVAAAGITIVRESDFYAGLWFHEGNSAPIFAASWILHIAVAFVVGILWFDWICGARDMDLVRWVAMPLAIGAIPMAAVAIYQWVFDITFYNESVYYSLGRATGTVFDANVCATIAAFWVGGAALIGDRLGRFRWPVTVAGMAVAWMVVWVTASRTGFGAAMIATASVAVSVWRSRGAKARLTWWSTAAIAALVVVAAAVRFTAAATHGIGPLQRLTGMLPDWSFASFAALASELWNRNGYGEAATVLIRRFPWFGIGIGAFHEMGPAVAWRELHIPSVPDNAQNWYRHQLVEFGLIGSIAWILWVLSFASFVIRRGRGEPPVRTVVRGVLLAFAFISLFGMPAQDVAVAMTFWTFAGLYVVLAPDQPRQAPAAGGRTWWLAAIASAVIFAIGTWHVGITKLRPPFRALHYGDGYTYGFNAIESDGRGGAQQWARRRAVAVVQATKSQLRLTISVNHLDLAERPVHARVWVNNDLAIDATLTTPNALVKDVVVPTGSRWIAITSEVDHSRMPSAGDGGDGRELGLLIGWEFVSLPGR